MTISTITINSIDYIAYASVAQADAYLAVDPTRSAAWAALTTDQKGANLVAATRRLDQLNWTGEKTVSTQINEWPRTGATCDGTVFASTTEVPQEVEDATILKAGSIALDATNANVNTSGSNIKRVQAGTAEVEFFQPTTGVALQDQTAFAIVNCYLAASSAGLSGSATGTDGTSSFCDKTFPSPSEGYS